MRFQIPFCQIVQNLRKHDGLLWYGLECEVLLEVSVLGQSDGCLLGGVATLPVTFLGNLDVVGGGTENLGLVEVVVAFNVSGGFVRGTVGTDDFHLNTVHILAVVLVADITGECIDERAEQEIVDVVTAAATLTVGGEVTLCQVRRLGLWINGLVLVENDADFVARGVDGNHQVLSFAKFTVLIMRDEKVKTAEAGMTVGGEVEFLFVTPNGEDFLSFGVDFRTQVGYVGEFASLFGTGGRIDVVATVAAGNIGGEPNSQFIIGNVRMDVVV